VSSLTKMSCKGMVVRVLENMESKSSRVQNIDAPEFLSKPSGLRVPGLTAY